MTDAGLRDRKKQQTRAALIEAALRLVDERGLEQVTVEEISAAADVSPRTFFNYFATKDEALIGDEFADQTRLLELFRAAEPGVPVVGALLLSIAPVITEMEAHRDLWFRRLRVMADNPSLVTGLMARTARAERELVVAIAERLGIDPGGGFPLLAAATTGAAFRAALTRWATTGGALSLDDCVHEAFGMLAAGLPDPTPDAPAVPVAPEESRKV